MRTWSKTSLSTWRVNLIGVFAGAAALLFFVSNAISRAPSLDGRLHDLNLSVSIFVNDVFVLSTRSTETSIFLLLMGALIWGAGHFCAVAVFRRHKPLPAIVLSGAILLLNVSLTVREQYLHLLVFAAAALRPGRAPQPARADGRMARRAACATWPTSRASFLRNGAVIVAVAIIASSVLAVNASSAPLARAWSNVDDELLEFGYTVNRWLGGVTGTARGPNVLFTPSQTIRDFWQSSSDEVFSARISDGVGRRLARRDVRLVRRHARGSSSTVSRPGRSTRASRFWRGTPEQMAPGDGLGDRHRRRSCRSTTAATSSSRRPSRSRSTSQQRS